MENQSKLRTIVVVSLIIIVLAIAAIMFFKKKAVVSDLPSNENPGQQCTMDARQCPDGTYVGRTGPNCEFICPTPTISTDSSTPAAENPIPVLIKSYSEMSTKYKLKYKTFNDAVIALQKQVGTNLVSPSKIDFYVPGKVPHEDGNPYFLFRSAIDQSKNDCLVGYMNLVSGEVESHHDVCVIYN